MKFAKILTYHWHAPPSSLGGIKILEKSLLGAGVRNFYFDGGSARGILCVCVCVCVVDWFLYDIGLGRKRVKLKSKEK